MIGPLQRTLEHYGATVHSVGGGDPELPPEPPLAALADAGVPVVDRAQYLSAMQRADNGDYGPLGELLARAMYDNLNRFIVPNLAGPARLAVVGVAGETADS